MTVCEVYTPSRKDFTDFYFKLKVSSDEINGVVVVVVAAADLSLTMGVCG